MCTTPRGRNRRSVRGSVSSRAGQSGCERGRSCSTRTCRMQTVCLHVSSGMSRQSLAGVHTTPRWSVPGDSWCSVRPATQWLRRLPRACLTASSPVRLGILRSRNSAASRSLLSHRRRVKSRSHVPTMNVGCEPQYARLAPARWCSGGRSRFGWVHRMTLARRR